MANLNMKISDNINKILSAGVIERRKDFYALAFFLSRDTEATLKNVKDCVSAGLFNARKIQTVPPVKTWFYQELIALCIKRGSTSESTVPAAYNKASFKQLSAMDSQTKAVFALYYFEELSKARIAKVMRMKEPAVIAKLSYACRELGITGKNKTKEEKVFEELTTAYYAPKLPPDYRKEIQAVIDREQDLSKAHLIKDRRSRRVRIAFGLVILAIIAYLIYSGNLTNIFK